MARSVDVLVVGGGSTGWTAAGNLARLGLEVLVVERRPEALGGARWLNQVPGWCFDDGGIARPLAPELWGGHHGDAHVTVAGTKAAVRVHKVDGLHVDMRALVSRLRDLAIGHGASFVSGDVSDPELSDGRVASVAVTDMGRVCARLFVDASGLHGVLRSRVPVLAANCPAVRPEDLCAAAQFQYEVSDPSALEAFLHIRGAKPGDSIAFLSLAGGYSTLTLFTEPSLREVGVLAGSITAMGAPSGAALVQAFVSKAGWVGRALYGGQAAIPVRRPYALLGAGGVALVGDAACQVYATHGSGVGMGLCAARLLADAVSGDDPGSEPVLHRYTMQFQRRYGGLLAGADAFRRLSQSLDHRHIAALIEDGLLDEKVLASGMAQRLPDAGARWLLERVIRGLGAPGTSARIFPTVLRMLALSALGHVSATPHTFGAQAHEALVERLVGRTPLRPARLDLQDIG